MKIFDTIFQLNKGAFTYDVRCFGVIFDLPTYLNLILSDVALPTYLLLDLKSDFEKFIPPINVHIYWYGVLIVTFILGAIHKRHWPIFLIL